MAGEGTANGLRDITFHLITLLVIATLGPLQFGFHLVRTLVLPFIRPSSAPTNPSPEPLLTLG